MAIIKSYISEDITKNDNKLSFKLSNNADYYMNILNDKYLIGKSEPIGFVGSVPDDLVSSGYKPKVVFTENITVELYKNSSNSSFYKKNILVEYYVQTKDTTSNTTTTTTTDLTTSTEGPGGGSTDLKRFTL